MLIRKSGHPTLRRLARKFLLMLVRPGVISRIMTRLCWSSLFLFALASMAVAQDNPPASSSQAPPNDAASQPYRVGVGVSAPKLIHDVDPEYSKEARKARYQGTVVLWLIVDAQGLPQKIRVQRSLGMGLDEEAVKAVSKWRFEPSKKDGQPVPVMINVEVNFRLYGSLSPHPDSAGNPPRFPGVDTSKYPLVVRVSSHSYSKGEAKQTSSYNADITGAGQQQQTRVWCYVDSSHCLYLDEGIYPARWTENTKELEILGVSSEDHKWAKAEHTVSSDQ